MPVVMQALQPSSCPTAPYGIGIWVSGEGGAGVGVGASLTWTEDPFGADAPLFGFWDSTVAVASFDSGGLISSFRDVLPRVLAAVASSIPCRAGTTSPP